MKILYKVCTIIYFNAVFISNISCASNDFNNLKCTAYKSDNFINKNELVYLNRNKNIINNNNNLYNPMQKLKTKKYCEIHYYYNNNLYILYTNRSQKERYYSLQYTDNHVIQNQEIAYYLKLLALMLNDVILLNIDIYNNSFNHYFSKDNSLTPSEILLVFSHLIDKTITTMLDSNSVKKYNLNNKLNNIINKFKKDYMISCGDNNILYNIFKIFLIKLMRMNIPLYDSAQYNNFVEMINKNKQYSIMNMNMA